MTEDRVDGLEPEEPDAFERQLTRALERVDAPVGFAARVMQCAAPQVKVRAIRSPLAAPRRRAWVAGAWAGGALAAALALGLFVGAQVHLRQEREQAALANRQFETAMRVTDHALDRTRVLLERAGLNLEN